MLILFLILIVLALVILIANIAIVPQAYSYVVERLGVYYTTWEAGFHFKTPFVTRIAKKLWLTEQGGDFNSGKLPSCYNGCVNLLRSKDIIDSKEQSILNTLVNKENFITLLNTWMHADTDACVSETPLISGWKNVRILIEKYIETHKK